jgi:hypothetical protein
MMLAGAKTAASISPTLIPTSEQSLAKKELDDLRRRQELGALGFTPEEMSADIEGQMAQTVALRQEQEDKAAALRGAGLNMGSGALLEDAAYQEAANQNMQRQAFNSALQRSEAEKVREEQRIDVLAAQKDETQQAMIEGIATGAATVFGGVSETLDMKRKIEGAAMSSEDLTAFANRLGVPENMAKQINQQLYENPDQFAKMMSFLTDLDKAGEK